MKKGIMLAVTLGAGMSARAGLVTTYDKALGEAQEKAAAMTAEFKREKEKKPQAASGRAAGEDIVRMLDQIDDSKSLYLAFGKLCNSSCNMLSAEQIGHILGRMEALCLQPVPYIEDECRQERVYWADYQRMAFIDVSWEDLSGKELSESILPRLRPENRGLAMQEWIDARRRSDRVTGKEAHE